jgi:hypothetical protein
LHRLGRASKLSNGIISKTVGPSEILNTSEFVENLIGYKKDSGHFPVGLTDPVLMGFLAFRLLERSLRRSSW